MAEHSVDDPVWDRPVGNGDPVDLAVLGVSAGLVARLRSRNEQFERLALLPDADWGSPAEEASWRRTGLHLAHERHREL
jgi:hypothetical protein